MGGKQKVGKARRDKYYHLAKESGFRARSAFKLIQLNRKFSFLAKSRVCLDLCAAPGGWMQVAKKYMPKSSIVVGVDLVPIRHIDGCVGITADITTEKCRSLLKKELKTAKADVVLHDGAPNVGQAWVQDAFAQNGLVLMSLKLAVEWLAPGGTFVTKVFRSKDYQSLIWVFKQLFEKVQATKPQSSRSVSAEIFVVCQKYRAPAKLDPRMLDPTYVFQELPDDKPEIDIFRETKKKKKAEGYEGPISQYIAADASMFVQSPDFLNIMGTHSEITFKQSEHIKALPLTTPEILAMCEDLKVLGKKDIRQLLKWRVNVRKALKINDTQATSDQSDDSDDDGENAETEQTDGDGDENMDVDDKLLQAEIDLARHQKQQMRKRRKGILKSKQRVAMKAAEDINEITRDESLFELRRVAKLTAATAVDSDDEEEWDIDQLPRQKSKYDEPEEDEDSDEDHITTLARDLETQYEDYLDSKGKKFRRPVQENKVPTPKLAAEPQGWFGQNVFGDVEDHLSDEDQDNEAGPNGHNKENDTDGSDEDEEDDDDADFFRAKNEAAAEAPAGSDDSGDDESNDGETDQQRKSKAKKQKDDDEDMEIVPADASFTPLSAHELAVAGEMVVRKRKRQLVDEAYNRYAFNDSVLPTWFEDEEKDHVRLGVQVTKEMAKDIKMRERALNARPIKRVLEAKGRKKRKDAVKMERASNAAAAILENATLTAKEKSSQIEQLYKKLRVKKEKPDTKYVVAKKSSASKRPKRPAGMTGRYLMVDKRMKNDKRAEQRASKRKKGKRRK